MTNLLASKSLAVVGGNSAIAQSCIRERAPHLRRLALCGRDTDALVAFSADLSARYPKLIIRWWSCDVMEVDQAAAVWGEMSAFCEVVDEALFAVGGLGNQSSMEVQPEEAYRLIALNSAASSMWVLLAASTLEAQGQGVLAVITSVAGDRGRRSNYIYGSSKAQLITLLEGIRCRLALRGCRVVDFRPGMVKTPMTAHLRKGVLMASSLSVGSRLARALISGGGVVYSPGYWGMVMFVIRHLPYVIFKKLKF